MPDISKITLPSGTTYDIKDATARQMIEDLENYAGYLGVTTTELVDGVTTSPVVSINGESKTATAGSIVMYGNKEFIYSGTVWQEFGDMSALGSLAYKNKASASYKPAGTVSKPTFTGSSTTFTGTLTPAGSVSQPTFTGAETESTGTFTPDGTVEVTTKTTSNKTATVAPAGSGTATYTPAGSCTGSAVELNTTTVNSITNVGTLPSLSTTVADETLTIGWSAGTLPTKGSNTTVATSVKTVTQPTFTGTGVRLVTGNIAVPSAYTATFTGTAGNVAVTGTPNGSVSAPTFSGTEATVSVSGTPNGSVSQPTFTGTQATIEVS